MTPVLYSFDTSAILNCRRDLFRPSVFRTLWAQIEGAIAVGQIRAVDEVQRELARRDDDAKQWAGNQVDLFCPLDTPIQEGARRILQLHPNLVRQGGLRSAADPFVIALAMVNNGTVVTEETASGNIDKPRIPDVCLALEEVGTIGTDILTEEVDGPRVLLLGGRSWKVTHVDWDRRRCYVEPADGGGQAKWSGLSGGLSYDITRGMRSVVLGELPAGVTFTARAAGVLAALRDTYGENAAADRLVVRLPHDSAGRWWTWAGTAANRTLQASLPGLVDPRQRIDEKSVRLLPGIGVEDFQTAVAAVEWRDPLVDANAVRGLKFSTALPQELAVQTLGARIGDGAHAKSAHSEERIFARSD